MNQNELSEEIEEVCDELNSLTGEIPDLPCTGDVQEELVKAYHHVDMARRKLDIEIAIEEKRKKRADRIRRE